MNELESKITNERISALEHLKEVLSQEALDAWKQEHLGKASLVMSMLGKMGSFSPEERKTVGQAVNLVRGVLEEACKEKLEVIKRDALMNRIASEKLDVSLPGYPVKRGRFHPINLSMREI